MKILSTIQAALGGVIHLVEEPFSDAGKLEALLATAKKDEPELKAAALKLVSLVEGVGADATADAAASGLNVTSDIKTFTDAAAVYSYVKITLVPLLKQVYGDFEADLATKSPAPVPLTPVAPVAVAAVSTGAPA